MKSVEQRLLPVFQRIAYWNSYSGDDSTINRYDSLEAANNTFQQVLTQVTAKYPASLHYSFASLRDSGLIAATSPDGKLRIYSWNSHTGGSMQIFKRVFQYQGPPGVRSTDQAGSSEQDGVEWSWKIMLFRTGRRSYYLAFNRAITCGVCRGEAVKVYSIGDKGLEGPLSLFRSDGLENSGLSIEFRDFGSKSLSRSGHAITYDSLLHTFKVPIIDEMNGTLSDHYITYAWEDGHFVKQ